MQLPHGDSTDATCVRLMPHTVTWNTGKGETPRVLMPGALPLFVGPGGWTWCGHGHTVRGLLVPAVLMPGVLALFVDDVKEQEGHTWPVPGIAV